MIRFVHGGAYTADIAALRNAIRANGTNVNCVAVPLSHPTAPGAPVNLYVNHAYQANSALAPANASIYTTAFSNGAGAIFRFAIVPALGGNCAFPGATALAADGSYASFGYPAPPLPNISDATLAQAIIDVRGHAGAGAPTAAVLTGLARLVIAVNEAVRFASIETGVNGVLGNAGLYAPNWATVHGWGGHSLGG